MCDFISAIRNKKKFYNFLSNITKTKRLWIRPQSFKNILTTFGCYFILLMFFLAAFIMFIMYGNVLSLVWAVVFS
ncbi:DUF443 family protein [Oceanobacillus sp. J11TS1]|uniref:DUF443 family protein n=1 Tax=Oceanobacillus sp. J11TS1 TaxID=2807191 RepID=UPI001BB3478D